MNKYRHTQEDYENAVYNSYTIAEVCRRLGILPKGGNYNTIKRKIVEYGLDTSHFTGQAWRTGSYSSSPNSKATIKNKLIRERGHKCEECGLEYWLEKPVSLELEHIDGNNTNNVLDNLKLLCLLCHSVTPTWRRKKSSLLPKTQPTGTRVRVQRNRCKCGNLIADQSKMCSGCRGKKQERIDWPDTPELIKMLSDANFSEISKALGVSDTAIRNRLKSRGINPKTLTKYTN